MRHALRSTRVLPIRPSGIPLRAISRWSPRPRAAVLSLYNPQGERPVFRDHRSTSRRVSLVRDCSSTVCAIASASPTRPRPTRSPAVRPQNVHRKERCGAQGAGRLIPLRRLADSGVRFRFLTNTSLDLPAHPPSPHEILASFLRVFLLSSAANLALRRWNGTRRTSSESSHGE